MVSEVAIDLGTDLTFYYWIIWGAGGLMILSGLIKPILRMFGISFDDDEDDDNDEEYQPRYIHETFKEQTKPKPKILKEPKCEMTEEDFNRSEFD